MRVSNVDKHSNEGEAPVRLCNYVDVYYHDRIRPEMAFMKATATPEEIQRFQLQRHDVLITKDSEAWDDIGVPSLVENGDSDLLSGYHLALLRPHLHLMTGGYLFRALQSPGVAGQLHVSANGVTRYGLSHGGIKATLVPLPPTVEQTAIARFLDHMDRRIQAYIRAKEKLIALLDEYKQALIHQAVTGQIDVRTGKPYGEYKESGVEWLGRVPAHWGVVGLGRLICLTPGFAFKSEGFTQVQEDIRLLRGVNIAPGRIRWEDVVRWPIGDVEEFTEYQLCEGDIVLGMDRPIIRTGIRVAQISESDTPALLLQRVARIRPKSELHPRFAAQILAGQGFYSYLSPIFTGISVPHLSPEQISRFRISLPPANEQTAILDRIKQSATQIDLSISAARQKLGLLAEYRTRLIADVVTGKFDVREAAARPQEPGSVPGPREA